MLFSFVGGNGHFEPLVPIARAAVAAGHTVTVTGEPSMAHPVAAAGFAFRPSGSDLGGSGKRSPLLPLDPDREDRDLRDGFARRTARRRVTDLLALAGDWRPDLVVCDEGDFGAMLAAERLGLPYASVVVIAAGSFMRVELLSEALNEVRAELGLPADPDLVMLHRHLVLSPVPPSYRDPAYPLPATAHSLRTAHFPPVPPERTGPSTVYFTLGTIFNTESGDLFSRVLSGLRALDVDAVVTTGRHIDPADFGPQTSRIRLERYVPQAQVLPQCDLVVSHGGSGSVLGALAHGLPMVLIPMGADQPHNARRCVELGVGLMLDPMTATPEQIREAVSAVLSDPGYRQAAEALRAEIAALPDAGSAIPLLEHLAP